MQHSDHWAWKPDIWQIFTHLLTLLFLPTYLTSTWAVWFIFDGLFQVLVLLLLLIPIQFLYILSTSDDCKLTSLERGSWTPLIFSSRSFACFSAVSKVLAFSSSRLLACSASSLCMLSYCFSYSHTSSGLLCFMLPGSEGVSTRRDTVGFKMSLSCVNTYLNSLKCLR